MATPKKRIFIVTVAVWMAGAGSAAALTYELNRPLSPSVSLEPTSVQVLPQPQPLENVAPTPEPAGFLVPASLPPGGQAVASTAHRARRALRPAKPIASMRCADWRGLEMGSGSVQVCD